MNRTGNLWWGLLLIALGVMFLLDNMNVIEFGEIVRTYWPALLVLWGIGILIGRSTPSVASAAEATAGAPAPPGEIREVFSDRHDNPAADYLQYSTVFGDLSLRALSTNFKGGSISTVFGDTTIDLSSVTLAEGENLLKLNGVFGDLRIILGLSMPHMITAHSLFGTIQALDQKREGFSPTVEMRSPDYAAATRKVHVDTSLVFGDIIVTR